MTKDLPVIPVRTSGSFLPVLGPMIALKCPACGRPVFEMSDGTFGNVAPLLVCERHLEARPNTRCPLIREMRQSRAHTMVSEMPDWLRHWPDCAVEYGMVRRLNPRKGDALQPATIRSFAYDWESWSVPAAANEVRILGRRAVEASWELSSGWVGGKWKPATTRDSARHHYF